MEISKKEFLLAVVLESIWVLIILLPLVGIWVVNEFKDMHYGAVKECEGYTLDTVCTDAPALAVCSKYCSIQPSSYYESKLEGKNKTEVCQRVHSEQKKMQNSSDYIFNLINNRLIENSTSD